MKATLLNAERALLLTILLAIGLDFFQPFIPVPVFAAIGVCSVLLLFILYLDGILNTNPDEKQSMGVLYTLFICFLSFAIVVFQKEHKTLQTSGVIAASIPLISDFQIAMLKQVSSSSENLSSKKSAQENLSQSANKETKYLVLKAISKPNYKPGEIKLTVLKPKKLNYNIPNTLAKADSKQKPANEDNLKSTDSIANPAKEQIEQKKNELITANKDQDENQDKEDNASTENKAAQKQIQKEDKETIARTEDKTTNLTIESAKKLLTQKGVPWSPAEFYKAASKGDIELLTLFVASGMKPETQLPYYKQSLIVALIQHNPEGIIKSLSYFASNGLDINKKFDVFYAAPDKMTQKSQRTLLELSVMNLNSDVVRFLKEKGVKTDQVLKLIANDFEASKIKSKKNQIQEMYHILTGKEFIPEKVKDINNKLAEALKISNTGLMEFYLLSGAKPHFMTKDEKPSYLLFKAARTVKAAEIVQLLIKYGVKVNQQSSTGRTALFVHTQMNRYKAVEALLNAKADPNLLANDGSTAIFTAAKENRIAILRLLIKAGAKVDVPTNNGKSALMVASHNGHKDIVEILLSNGANAQIRDKKGLSPIDYANVNGNQKIIFLLSKRGAELKDPLSW